MSDTERKKRIEQFWAYFAPMHGSIRCTREFFTDDDCPVAERMIIQ